MRWTNKRSFLPALGRDVHGMCARTAECLEREREVLAQMPPEFNMTELPFRYVNGTQLPPFSANITAEEVRAPGSSAALLSCRVGCPEPHAPAVSYAHYYYPTAVLSAVSYTHLTLPTILLV